MTVRSPFYPCQTEAGSTYVVDSRTDRVVREFLIPADVVGRWKRAKTHADKLNLEHVRRTYAMRQRRTVALLALAVILGAVEVGTGALSNLAESVISATR
jgi:hypothetical protein